jgi:ABC-type transport system involved in Fe-S cluster assembly fused permease/ATPase subunit
VRSILFDKLPALVDLVIAVLAFCRIFGGQLAAAMAAISVIYLWVSAKLTPQRQIDFKKALRLSRERDDLASDALRDWYTVAALNSVEYEQRRHQEATLRLRLVGEELRVSETVASSRKDPDHGIGVGHHVSAGDLQIKMGGGHRSVGDFVMLLQYWNDLAFPIQNFVHWMAWLDEFFVEPDKMIEIMDAEPTVRDKEDAVDFQLKNGDIEFDNVGFSYDGKRPAVKKMSFNIEGGKRSCWKEEGTTLIFGTSRGSTKSHGPHVNVSPRSQIRMAWACPSSSPCIVTDSTTNKSWKQRCEERTGHGDVRIP